MKEEIEAAVNWWCEQLNQMSIGTSGDGDVDMWFVLVTRGAPALPTEQISAFQSSLTRLLERHFEQFDYCHLSTDYGPEGRLEEALAEAKINNAMSYLPMKTIMSIRAGSVQVACGYGAQYMTIYPETSKLEKNV